MPLSNIDLEAYFNKHKIPEAGRELYRQTKAAPSRLVTEGGALNQCSAPFSEKMGFTIQSESRTGEYQMIYEFEMDDEVIEFYDQMPPVKIRGLSVSGKPITYTVRSDFLVAHSSGIKVIEVKADSVIEKKLKQKHPSWSKGKDGTIHYIPLEKPFSKLGFTYIIRPVSSFNKILTENNKLLLTSCREPPPTPELSQKILRTLQDHACLPMRELMKHCSIVDATPVLQLIYAKKVFFENEYEFLDDVDNVFLSSSRDLSRHFRSLRLQKRITLEMMDSEVTSIPSRADAEETLNKLTRIENGEKGRSIQRWEKQIREGEKRGLSPYESLLPKNKDKGNSKPKRAQAVYPVIREAIDKYYANKKRASVTSAYIRYRKYALEKHPLEEPVAEETFRITNKIKIKNTSAFSCII